jgi:hypothetical protein
MFWIVQQEQWSRQYGGLRITKVQGLGRNLSVRSGGDAAGRRQLYIAC